ncbi:hypothetical protein QNO00_05375 [Arthrobacter sp. zg-Y1219]|uniref:hypothetical protein n=1 Tax=Arthrobacter sp. zg-Y1219 TaxID=3049067 RepID=UPI0024C43C0D|nr:hypothetical protein [Arthrobacter sp. zg-Y1219]MDK1359697.1 hypothetical protein [Arthrobacter sp. zg-Y1219]
MDPTTNYWALFAILFPWGLFLCLVGILTYRKKFLRFLAVDDFFPGKPSLATTYLGTFIMLIASAHFVSVADLEALTVPFGLALFTSWLLGVGGIFWMPKFLQPAWMKEADRLMARGEDLFAKRFLQGGS